MRLDVGHAHNCIFPFTQKSDKTVLITRCMQIANAFRMNYACVFEK